MGEERIGGDGTGDLAAIAAALECNVQTCDICACRYVEWWANEELWEAIVGSYEGLLCIDCFRLRCYEKGIVTVLIDSMSRWSGVSHSGRNQP